VRGMISLSDNRLKCVMVAAGGGGGRSARYIFAAHPGKILNRNNARFRA
jgi:hypothetical protein